MKPVFTTGRPAHKGEVRSGFSNNSPKAPLTDWSYQATADIRGGTSSFAQKRESFRAFRKLTDSFIEAETRRDRIEGAAFAVLIALMAWPLGLAAQAAFQAFQLIP